MTEPTPTPQGGEPDAPDELIAVGSARWPGYRDLYDSEVRRRLLLIELGGIRRERGLSQTQVAAAMGTSQSAVAKLERGESDPRISTVARFAHAVGHRLEFALVPLPDDGAAVDAQRSA
ncbi:MAG: helix-turn-helix domain-containing protein [Actinomycetota bacterium]